MRSTRPLRGLAAAAGASLLWGTHLVYPLQIALFLVFIRIGDHFFHTGHMPLEGHALPLTSA